MMLFSPWLEITDDLRNDSQMLLVMIGVCHAAMFDTLR
jgi:hypothetical protein